MSEKVRESKRERYREEIGWERKDKKWEVSEIEYREKEERSEEGEERREKLRIGEKEGRLESEKRE